MPKTRLDFQTKIQQNLNDAVGVFFNPTDVQESIQDIYTEVILETQCVESVGTINFTGGGLYYDLYSATAQLPGFWRASRLYNHDTNRWLRCVDSRVYDKFRFDWETANATPWFAYIVNFQYISFFPHWTGGVQLGETSTFDVFYKIGQDVLVDDNQFLQIPDPYSRVIESGASADLLEQIQEFQKAEEYWEDYNEIVQKLKNHVPSRMLPDKYWQSNDLDWPNFWAP